MTYLRQTPYATSSHCTRPSRLGNHALSDHPRPCGHLSPPLRDGDEPQESYQQRLLDFAKSGSAAGHEVTIFPTASGIAKGLSPQECQELAQAGVKVVVEPELARIAKSTDGLQMLADNGVEVAFYRPPHQRHEHTKALIVDGYLIGNPGFATAGPAPITPQMDSRNAGEAISQANSDWLMAWNA